MIKEKAFAIITNHRNNILNCVILRPSVAFHHHALRHWGVCGQSSDIVDYNMAKKYLYGIGRTVWPPTLMLMQNGGMKTQESQLNLLLKKNHFVHRRYGARSAREHVSTSVSIYKLILSEPCIMQYPCNELTKSLTLPHVFVTSRLCIVIVLKSIGQRE